MQSSIDDLEKKIQHYNTVQNQLINILFVILGVLASLIWWLGVVYLTI